MRMKGPVFPPALCISFACLHAVEAELGGAAVAFEAFAGGLSCCRRSYLLDAFFIEPLMRGDLHIGADPEAAGIGARAHGGEGMVGARILVGIDDAGEFADKQAAVIPQLF